MADYAEMYRVLFRAMTKAIRVMQEAQLAAEEIYISNVEPIIAVLPRADGSENEDGDHS